MWIDITIGVLFLLFLIAGIIRGFAVSLARTIGWPVGFVLGYVFCGKFSVWAMENTKIYDKLLTAIAPKLADATGTAVQKFLDQLPKGLEKIVAESANGLSDTVAEKASSVILTLLCFLAIVLAVRLVLFVFTLLFSKRYHKKDSAISRTDRGLGILLGAVSGLFAVCVFLAFLLPVAELFSIEGIPEALEASHVAKVIYNNNLIFLFAERFLV